MTPWPGRPLPRALAVLVGAGLAATLATALELTPQERAGKRLYREGVGSSGAGVRATVGIDASPVPGHAVPCANCHGPDGAGRAEGAVLPPAITWSALTKPYGHLHDNGRRHPAFTEAHLERAVTLGLDPAGNPLERTMPRYALGRQDMAHLIAYLKRLEHDSDPGVRPATLRVGTLLPASGPLQPVGQAVRQLLAASFADLNAAGGLYGRQLELVAVEQGGPRAEMLAQAHRLLVEGDVLALVAPVAPGIEPELARLAEEHRVPVIGPFGMDGPPAGTATRYTFQLQSGLREQVRALVVYATQAAAAQGHPPMLVASDSQAYAPLVEALQAQCRQADCGALAAQVYPAGAFDAAAAVDLQQASAASTLFFIGPEADLEALLRACAARGSHPWVLVPGALGARAAARAPAAFDGRVLLAYPGAPPEAIAAGEGFAALRARHALTAGPLAAQAAGYAATALLAEGLRRSGRAVSRETLVAALEQVRAFNTGVTPPLTYGPGRRVGAPGAFIVTLDARRGVFRPVSPWLPLE